MGGDLGRENSKCNDSEVGLSVARNGKKTSVGEEEEGEGDRYGCGSGEQHWS